MAVANPDGDLDAYVVHHDHADKFSTPELTELWDTLSERMHKMLPTACARARGHQTPPQHTARLSLLSQRDCDCAHAGHGGDGGGIERGGAARRA